MAMNGIDVASYQKSLDLNNINYDFVMIKATEGTGYVNPYCDMHYQEAKAAGKKRAVYHFTNFGDAIAEANFFVDNTIGYIRDAIFVLDWEGAGVADVDWALRFLQQVESRIGYKPAIYMSQYVENTYDWSSVVANDNGLVEARYADYEIDNNYDMSGAGQAPVCTHWPFYFMWQWTSKGHLSGYAGDLDCDIAFLDGDAWDRYAGIQAAPTPDPTPEPTPDPEPTPPVEPPVVVPPVEEPTVPPVVVVVKKSMLLVFKENVMKVFHTFWQTFLGFFALIQTSILTDLLKVHNLSEARVFGASALVAVGGAFFAAVKATYKYYKAKKSNGDK